MIFCRVKWPFLNRCFLTTQSVVITAFPVDERENTGNNASVTMRPPWLGVINHQRAEDFSTPKWRSVRISSRHWWIYHLVRCSLIRGATTFGSDLRFICCYWTQSLTSWLLNCLRRAGVVLLLGVWMVWRLKDVFFV